MTEFDPAKWWPKQVFVVVVPPCCVIDYIPPFDSFAVDYRQNQLLYYFERLKAEAAVVKLRRWQPILRTEMHHQRWVARYRSPNKSEWNFEFVTAPTPDDAKQMVLQQHASASDIDVTPGNASDLFDFMAGRKPFVPCSHITTGIGSR